jgi:hypothetical protein
MSTPDPCFGCAAHQGPEGGTGTLMVSRNYRHAHSLGGYLIWCHTEKSCTLFHPCDNIRRMLCGQKRPILSNLSRFS